MKWTRGQRSRNLEDRRGQRGSRLPIPRGRGGRMGLGTLLLLFVLSIVFKQDFFSLVGGGGGMSTQSTQTRSPAMTDAAEEEMVDFMSFVLDDNQAIWGRILPSTLGKSYPEAKLVLFRDYVRSGCGAAQASTGPFYCPADQKVYLDLSFFSELSRRFGAPGDFAQAYVIAHEIGHHVQHVLGITRQMRSMQQQRPDLANQLSVRLELQADCLAGIWAHSTARRDLLERGDVEEGISAAAAVGDDRIQRQAGRYVNPETFTHGTSQQRVEWFRVGFESGDPNACDTFASDAL